MFENIDEDLQGKESDRLGSWGSLDAQVSILSTTPPLRPSPARRLGPAANESLLVNYRVACVVVSELQGMSIEKHYKLYRDQIFDDTQALNCAQ